VRRGAAWCGVVRRGAAWCGVVRRGAECLTDEANKALLKQDH